MSEKQFVIRVFGKVQGVWFRKSTRDEALKLGLKGLVYNEPDGSVYIVARGEESKLDEFISYCRRGPEKAKVENVLVFEEDLTEFESFKII